MSRISMHLFAGLLLAVSPFVHAETASPLAAALAGHWLGSLQYRDYGNDRQVVLPTELDVAPASDGSGLELRYVYDDGPNKTVRERATLKADFATSRYRVESDDGTVDVYRIVERKGFGESADGSLLLLGPGSENNLPVEARVSLTRYGDLLRIVRETRSGKAAFRIRH